MRIAKLAVGTVLALALAGCQSLIPQEMSVGDYCADEAKATAEAALAKTDEMVCETRTVQKSDTGTCRPGYTLTSCTQTRYTTRAGGLSFLREINDAQCRFNDRVLEMQVRCCNTASAAPAPEDDTINANMPEPEATPEAPAESPLGY